MKNILLVLSVLFLAGCCETSPTDRVTEKAAESKEITLSEMPLFGYFKEIQHKNHEYLLYERSSGGIFMLHSESCPCKIK
jgi:hypothetical protein